MQFRYGDDGLDPAELEGDAQPIEYVRAWLHASVSLPTFHACFYASLHLNGIQAVSSRTGRGLLPFEILELADNELSQPKFRSECTAAYIATVRSFILDSIVRRMARYRKKHNMFSAEEREAEWDEDVDLSLGATGTFNLPSFRLGFHQCDEHCRRREGHRG